MDYGKRQDPEQPLTTGTSVNTGASLLSAHKRSNTARDQPCSSPQPIPASSEARPRSTGLRWDKREGKSSAAKPPPLKPASPLSTAPAPVWGAPKGGPGPSLPVAPRGRRPHLLLRRLLADPEQPIQVQLQQVPTDRHLDALRRPALKHNPQTPQHPRQRRHRDYIYRDAPRPGNSRGRGACWGCSFLAAAASQAGRARDYNSRRALRRGADARRSSGLSSLPRAEGNGCSQADPNAALAPGRGGWPEASVS